MHMLVDDIGSFPLPSGINRRSFDEAYVLARQAVAGGEDVRKDEFLFNNFYRVVADSFRKKLETGLDVVNYPQHCDMHRQFTDVIHESMEKGTYLAAEKDAIIPEIYVIDKEARRLHEEAGSKVSLRVCVTGPMELYLREIGTTSYKDVLLMFAENVRLFAKNSILNSKHVKTEVIALDEPSFGFHDVAAEKDTILDVLEKAFDLKGVTKHVHIHSSSRVQDVLDVSNLDTLSLEYAASPRNIDDISKSVLEETDKQIRLGISRTDIDAIVAELQDEGIAKPSMEQLVESEAVIRRRLNLAEEKYGELMTFAGPDCGLMGWPTQEAAQLLLKRTVNAAKSAASRA